MGAKIYYYKLTADNGGAPCVDDGLLSLAICKPLIRTGASVGDLIFGFAASALDGTNSLIYVAEITAIVPEGRYYQEPRYAGRADCIYARRGDRFEWRTGALHHGPEHLSHDLGPYPTYPRARVLLSESFRYLGARGTADYKSRYPFVRNAVECLGQGHRVNHTERLVAQLLALKQDLWTGFRRKVVGRPRSAPDRCVCHRVRSCGVIDAPEGC